MAATEQVTVPTALGDIPVRIFGERGPAIVMTHGFFVDGRLWDPVALLLADEFRVVLPDLPLGAHRVPVPDRSLLTPAGVADALSAVARAVPGPRGMVAFDTGGAVSQLALAVTPELVDAIAFGPCDAFEHFPPPMIKPLAWAERIPGGLKATYAILGSPKLQHLPHPLALVAKRKVDPDLVRAWAAPARKDPEIRKDAAHFIRGMSGQELTAADERIRGWSKSALVFWARDELVFPKKDAHRLLGLFPKGELRWIEDSRTFTSLDQPEQTTEVLRAFFRRAFSAG